MKTCKICIYYKQTPDDTCEFGTCSRYPKTEAKKGNEFCGEFKQTNN